MCMHVLVCVRVSACVCVHACVCIVCTVILYICIYVYICIYIYIFYVKGSRQNFNYVFVLFFRLSFWNQTQDLLVEKLSMLLRFTNPLSLLNFYVHAMKYDHINLISHFSHPTSPQEFLLLTMFYKPTKSQ